MVIVLWSSGKTSDSGSEIKGSNPFGTTIFEVFIMSKIQELLNSDDTILVFDIDGVLARMEFGEYNHYYSSDEDWSKKIEEGYNFLLIFALLKYAQKVMKYLLIIILQNKIMLELKKNNFYQISK